MPSADARIDVSVVIPVRNEEDNIVPLLEEVERNLGGLDHEILVVDDGSTDGTPTRLADAIRRFQHLRVLRHRHNRGQSAAVWTGVRHARGEWIFTLDGDGQNDPGDFARLWQARGTADMLVGHRVKRQDKLMKRVGSRIANRLRSRFLGDATPDSGSGIKLFRRSLFLDLPYFDHMHRFLPALAIRHAATVVTVPVNHRPRRSGRSNYGELSRLWAGIVDILGVSWLMRRSRFPIESDELKR